jgi:hypothetical protein
VCIYDDDDDDAVVCDFSCGLQNCGARISFFGLFHL